ncbi:MAG: alpha/beta hydrolase-fold protein [Verrucomicrobiota bacterium]|jgi:S-formylglutathione hydrolase FrmB
MKKISPLLSFLLCVAPLATLPANSPNSASWRFEVAINKSLTTPARDGRLFVILARTNNPDPRFMLGWTGLDAPQVLARDLKSFTPGAVAVLDASAFAFPITNLAEVPAGDYFAQALFDSNTDLRLAAAPGNLYSKPHKIRLDPAQGGDWKLELTEQIPAEQLPAETKQIKFVKIQSKLLSEFYGRAIFLRAGIVLPHDYERDPSRRYPLWVCIGGLNTRYTEVLDLMEKKSEFAKTWQAGDTPRLILLQLDGAGPNGDPYYVNSANNGPFGDALVQELIPQVEARFRAIGQPRARVLSGNSTGGWVSLALQVFYPDFFNGTWSSCPDPVDFRALELVSIYQDDNAYVNQYGNERPSDRDANGDVRLTMRREVGVENLLGRANSYTLSGEQWGDWNAVFGPRGADGLPVPLWDPQSGRINHAVAEQWKKYDLRIVLEENWKTLGPELRGKIHIAAGEADEYFLNNAVHLLHKFLSKANPPFEGKIVYGPGKGHGWMDLSLRQMLDEMQAAAAAE